MGYPPLVEIIPFIRSLVTRLDAANKYQHDHLLSGEVWNELERSTVFYISVSEALVLVLGPLMEGLNSYTIKKYIVPSLQISLTN